MTAPCVLCDDTKIVWHPDDMRKIGDLYVLHPGSWRRLLAPAPLSPLLPRKEPSVRILAIFDPGCDQTVSAIEADVPTEPRTVESLIALVTADLRQSHPEFTYFSSQYHTANDTLVIYAGKPTCTAKMNTISSALTGGPQQCGVNPVPMKSKLNNPPPAQPPPR